MNLVAEAATVPVVPTLMPKRSYNQYCALANALDRVGGKWATIPMAHLPPTVNSAGGASRS